MSVCIASRYALALFGSTSTKSEFAAVKKSMSAVAGILEDESDSPITKFLNSVNISSADQEKVFSALIKMKKIKLHKVVSSLISILIQNKRFYLFSTVYSLYLDLLDEKDGVVHARVSSATKLTKAKSDEIKKALERVLAKSVVINAEVDESLIGGIMVWVGSYLLDNTIQTKLKKLARHMSDVTVST